MFAFEPAYIDDDDYLTRYVTACDPDGKPVHPDDLPDARAILKLEYGLLPRDADEKALMASYARLVALIKNRSVPPSGGTP